MAIKDLDLIDLVYRGWNADSLARRFNFKVDEVRKLVEEWRAIQKWLT